MTSASEDTVGMARNLIAAKLANQQTVREPILRPVKRHEELERWRHEELDTRKSSSDLGDVWPRAGLVHKASPVLFAETVAVAADGDDMAVVEQPIQDGRGDYRIPDDVMMPSSGIVMPA